jgi:hypothetical protein
MLFHCPYHSGGNHMSKQEEELLNLKKSVGIIGS